MAQDLDVITIGRSSVDLYGQQVGGRLEDMGSFAKSVGGCPSNIAIGAARLGLKSAVLTRVGDEHMGRYIREQMAREGVAIDGIITDPKRLTALVILGVRDSDSFPLIFYRTDCADMALDESDVDPAFFRRARAIVVTGTHFSTPTTAAAQRKAMKIARETGAKIVFDIDYRPNLWGLAGHGAGESRYIASDRVSQHLQPILPDCDLIVGTEEEVKIAGGADDVLTALRNIRVRSGATIVLKRGPKGCTVFPDAIPDERRPGHRRQRLSDRGLQRAGCRRCLHVWLPARLADRRSAGDLRDLGQCLRRVRGVAPAVLAGDPDLDRAAVLPEIRQQASRAAPRRGPQPHPLVDHAARPLADADGVRHRPSRPAGGAGRQGRRAPCAHRRFQGAGGGGGDQGCGRPAGLRHAARRDLWPRGAVPRRRS